MFKSRSLLVAGFAALAWTVTSASAAPIAFNVLVNTSSVAATTGFLDFQFNPVNGTSQAATLTVTNFTGGTLGGAPSTSGNISGTLPSTLTFVNSAALNEYFQGFTYGASFGFTVTLSGPAIDTPNGIATAGSTFGLGLYDSGSNPILTNQGKSTGFAGEIDINLNGTATPTAFPNFTAPSVVSFTPVSAAPEPGSFVLSGIPIAFVILRRVRAGRHKHAV
jgi:hypothetical protein